MRGIISLIMHERTCNPNARDLLFRTLSNEITKFNLNFQVLTISEGQTQQSYVFLDKLRRSFGVIIDATQNSFALNYTYGIVLGLRKPIIVIQQTLEHLAFDLQRVRFDEYPLEASDDWTAFDGRFTITFRV